MIAALFRDLGRLIQFWWLNDRIRISPSEGRLLQIKPGDLLRFGERQAEIEGRSLVSKNDGFILCLNGRTWKGPVMLEIEVAVDGALSSILWREDDHDRLFSPEDCEVWPRHRMV